MAEADERRFDLIAMGRAAVDFYGEQIGGRLEDMATFAKYLGGCAANIAVGSARLGHKVAMLTRVGDEHMGRFVRETLADEGIDVSHVVTDPERLTGSVVLGIIDDHTFPHIFFRESCADMGLAAQDFDADFIGSASALLVIGTHFSTPETDAVCRRAMALARERGTRVVLDIDYRPVLWGLTGHGGGESRFIASDHVSAHLQSIVPSCDLVVGTEEEMHIAGGTTDTLAALRRLRECTQATLVLKRGARGCAIFTGAIPNRIEDGIVDAGFPTEVFNALGAGDAFMAGLLSGWLGGADWAEAARIGNACGSLVVARHGCAPAMPSRAELAEFLRRSAEITQPHKDTRIAHIHRATTGPKSPPTICALAFDHRRQFAELAEAHGAGEDRIRSFKTLVAEALARLPADEAGAIIDDGYGREALRRLTATGRWIARPVEVAGSRPLAFEAGNWLASALRTWPVGHVAKCLVAFRADDPQELRAQQEAALTMLQDAAIAAERRWLLEVIPPHVESDPETIVAAMERLYAVGLLPGWWKLPPVADATIWKELARIVRASDPWCHGVVVLGLDRSEEALGAAFEAAIRSGIGVGFAVGRSIWRRPAEAWFAGALDDAGAGLEIADRFATVRGLWRKLAGIQSLRDTGISLDQPAIR